jgi:hypothetical protein
MRAADPGRRQRDFVDIANRADLDLDERTLDESVRRLAGHRHVSIEPLRFRLPSKS